VAKPLDELTKQAEERWRDRWESSGVYRYDPARGRDQSFVVDTPPPTVSGSLHIGSVCSYTHTDLMVRHQRMRGKNIFYPMGWDDNGLPTERRVQNVFNVRCDPSLPFDPDLELEPGREGDVIAVSRPNFIALCDRVVTEDERKFKEVFQRIGLSVDWRHTYATIDERSRYVSQYSFLKLVAAGHAELREAPTMWDVDYRSAIAQAEIEDRERDGLFYRVRFEIDGGGDFLVATTRPELLPACIAVTAHPEDERYAHLIGKTAITPLFGAPVPVIADAKADPTKGTGILMVCTFGDAADVEQWRQLGVPAREVIGADGRIKPAPWGEGHWTSGEPEAARRVHDKLAGLTVTQARREVAELLAEEGLVDGDLEPIRRPVKFYERGERPLEFIVSRQWFVKILDKKAALLEQGRKIAWHPDLMRRRYEDWVEGLNQDWSVSRQRYFGVGIPVWYAVNEDGGVDHSRLLLPRKEDLPIDPSTDVPPGYEESQRGSPGGFVGDPDVLDTWATSSLTPLIPTGWPDDEERFRALYPNDMRPQAHEIIRTWAFYTITRSLLEDGSIPWRHAAISGFVVDPDRKKMSKSKGNVVLPTDVLDQYGSDAVRYWAGSSRLGVDTAVDYNVYREGRRLTTKLRNASRLILGYEGSPGLPTHPLDRALIARLAVLIERVTSEWDDWDHAGALALTETWFWSDLCDNYLELSKARAYAGDPSALGTLRTALDVVLRLFAPFVPFVTEDIFASGSETGSIHRAAWPTRGELPEGEDTGCFDAAVAVLTEVRRAKSQAKVSQRWPVAELTVRGPRERLHVLTSVMSDVERTVNAERSALTAKESLDDLAVFLKLAEERPDGS
jgi:valyl-tRNA synthetase